MKCYNLYECFTLFIFVAINRLYVAKSGVTWCSSFVFVVLVFLSSLFSSLLFSLLLSSALFWYTHNLRRWNGFYQQLTSIRLTHTHTHAYGNTTCIHWQLLPNKLFSLVFGRQLYLILRNRLNTPHFHLPFDVVYAIPK